MPISKLSILWVEDKPNEIRAVAESLDSAGHSVYHVPSRQAAEVALSKLDTMFDLILLDEWMNDEEVEDERSGFFLFEKIRKGTWGDWGKTVPIIFITGWAQIVNDLVKSLVDDSATRPPLGIISKPVERDSTTEIILGKFLSDSTGRDTEES